MDTSKYDSVSMAFLLTSKEFLKYLEELFNNFEVQIEVLTPEGREEIVSWKPFTVDICTNNLEEFAKKLALLRYTTNIYVIDFSINGALEWFQAIHRTASIEDLEQYNIILQEQNKKFNIYNPPKKIITSLEVNTYIAIFPDSLEEDIKIICRDLNEITGGNLYNQVWTVSSPELTIGNLVKAIFTVFASLVKIIVRNPDLSYSGDKTIVNIGTLLLNKLAVDNVSNVPYSKVLTAEFERDYDLEKFEEENIKLLLTIEQNKAKEEEEIKTNGILGKMLKFVQKPKIQPTEKNKEMEQIEAVKEEIKVKKEPVKNETVEEKEYVLEPIGESKIKDETLEELKKNLITEEEREAIVIDELKDKNIFKKEEEVQEIMLPPVPTLNKSALNKIKTKKIFYFAGIKGGIGLTRFLLELCKQLQTKYKVCYVDMNYTHSGDALVYLQIKKPYYFTRITNNFYYYYPVINIDEEFDIAIVDLGTFIPLDLAKQEKVFVMFNKKDQVAQFHKKSLQDYFNLEFFEEEEWETEKKLNITF